MAEKDQIVEEDKAVEEKSTKETKAKKVKKKKVKKEDAKIAELETELAEFKDKYLRLYSEFDNFRKRTSKERIELISTASEKVILDLLPILDDFERAQKAYSEETEAKPIKEGVSLIQDKMSKILLAKGLKPIEAIGETFDTELHEAITQIPAPTEDLKGKIIDDIEKGYFLGEKVIRYSKVVIGA